MVRSSPASWPTPFLESVTQPEVMLAKATQIVGKGCATRSLVSSHRGNQGLTSQVEVCRGRGGGLPRGGADLEPAGRRSRPAPRQHHQDHRQGRDAGQEVAGTTRRRGERLGGRSGPPL